MAASQSQAERDSISISRWNYECKQFQGSSDSSERPIAPRSNLFPHHFLWLIYSSWILPLPLVLTLPAVLQAQFTFTTNNGTITITGYAGSGGAVTIPDTINGLPVTDIGDDTFDHRSRPTSVTIGTNVTNIGECAFGWCGSLKAITIPNSVTSIGFGGFYLCTSLTSVPIPDSVTSIAPNAFYGCSA